MGLTTSCLLNQGLSGHCLHSTGCRLERGRRFGQLRDPKGLAPPCPRTWATGTLSPRAALAQAENALSTRVSPRAVVVCMHWLGRPVLTSKQF